jgi:diguanylate cyclase (GGDEF)-like protein/PAS domain S-box-containing protein
LRESEYRWKFAVEGSGYGLWDWSVVNGTVFFSKHWKEMLGFTEDEIGDSLDEWEQRIHPDDKAETLAVVQAYLEGKNPIYISEYRVSCKDGSWKWILDRGIVVSRDAEGKPLRMIGTHADISERKQMEEKLRDSDAFNASILNSLTSHISVLDAQGVIVAVNNAWRQFAKENGLQEFSQSMLGVNYLDACKNAINQPYGDEASAAQAGILAVLAGEREAFHLEYPCHSPDQQRWFRMNVSPLQGSRRWVVVSHENITERKEMEAQLQKLARTDPLTGLFNRREFLERLELEVEKATRLSHYSAVLLMLDLDFFKRINDTYGHGTGDAVLKAVAEILHNTSRAIDVPARLGGEEFAVLLSGADKNEALAIAERLREQVATIVIDHEAGPVTITVSIGAASLSADDINGEAVLHRADTALYEAKDRGRNQTCWFGF